MCQYVLPLSECATLLKSHYRKVKQLEETGEGKLVGIVVTESS